jgi:hypothetical protein
MKKLILSLVLMGMLFAYTPVFAKNALTKEEINQQLITLLTQMISKLQQQIADILAKKQPQTAAVSQFLPPAPLVSVSSNIFVNSPKLKDEWVKGKSYTIAWTSTGVDKLKIQVFNEGWPSFADNPFINDSYIPASLGSYAYTVPLDKFIGTKYKIKISGLDYFGKYVFGESDYFSVVETDKK